MPRLRSAKQNEVHVYFNQTGLSLYEAAPILISLTGTKLGLVTGMLPMRIAFGGNLARDATRTEPFICYTTLL